MSAIVLPASLFLDPARCFMTVGRSLSVSSQSGPRLSVWSRFTARLTTTWRFLREADRQADNLTYMTRAVLPRSVASTQTLSALAWLVVIAAAVVFRRKPGPNRLRARH